MICRLWTDRSPEIAVPVGFFQCGSLPGRAFSANQNDVEIDGFLSPMLGQSHRHLGLHRLSLRCGIVACIPHPPTVPRLGRRSTAGSPDRASRSSVSIERFSGRAAGAAAASGQLREALAIEGRLPGQASLASAIAAATGLESTPSERKPGNRAAKFVVPRPQKGSRTARCCLARPCRILSGNLSGNRVKYGHIAFNAAFAAGAVIPGHAFLLRIYVGFVGLL